MEIENKGGVHVEQSPTEAGPPPAMKGVPEEQKGSESQTRSSPHSRGSSEERTALPTKQQQRFYFESDFLALKNNPE